MHARQACLLARMAPPPPRRPPRSRTRSTYTDTHTHTDTHHGPTPAQVAAGVSDFVIQGNHIGNVFANQAQASTAHGVMIEAGASDRFVVAGNTLTGNLQSGLSDSSTGVNKAVANNIPL